MVLRHQLVLLLLAISLVFCPCEAANELLQRQIDTGRNALRRADMDADMKKEIHAKICTMVREGNMAGLEGILSEYNVELNEVICLHYSPKAVTPFYNSKTITSPKADMSRWCFAETNLIRSICYRPFFQQELCHLDIFTPYCQNQGCSTILQK